MFIIDYNLGGKWGIAESPGICEIKNEHKLINVSSLMMRSKQIRLSDQF